MTNQETVLLLNALAQENRLDIYQLLIKYGSTGLPAGKIAEQLSIPNATLSFHLKEMTYAKILESEQQGRFIYYKINLTMIEYLVNFFKKDCCCLDEANSTCNLTNKE